MTIPYLLHTPLPSANDTRILWQNLPGDSLALALAEAAQQCQRLLVVITADHLLAHQLHASLQFFLASAPDIPLLHFPDWETLPYDCFSPHQDIISQRLACLARLPQQQRGILLIGINTLMQRLAPRQHIAAHSLHLTCGQTLAVEPFRQQLQTTGYRCVQQVLEHGEFALRGSILDIYPMGSTLPYRIDWCDDEIDSIRTFDPDNQRSIDTIADIALLPAQEFPLNDAGISLFRQQWRATFDGNPSQCPIYQQVSQGHKIPGIEYYLPLFFPHTSTLLDYLPADSILVRTDQINHAAEQFWQHIQHRHEQLRHDYQRPLLPPMQLFIPTQDIFAGMQPWQQIHYTAETKVDGKSPAFPCAPIPTVQSNNKQEQPFAALQQFIAQYPGRLLFCSESTGRREALLELLQTIPLAVKPCASWQAFLTEETAIGITVADIQHGFRITDYPLNVIAENQLFAQYTRPQRQHKNTLHDPQAIVRDLLELHIGAPVVHLEHGIGRYLGLQNLTIGDHSAEFIALAYANDDKVYVPVTSLHLISRYSGADAGHVTLHQLGNKQWGIAKRKAAEKIRDVAAELLALYAKRAAKPGVAFPPLDAAYHRFAHGFSFTETPDQARAISAVLTDMHSTKTMDRLVCGDVGFGKTEVAMRAAFVAAYAGKQVAIFVPTTLLAQQHYETFSDRFADWPIKVEMLSRFRSSKQQQLIQQQLAQGLIDIIIGTHSLLSKSLHFKALGLLIVDEEHRFGVNHKERIRTLCENIDTLTLTATPIPRTLHMAISGIRDLSIIATPPEKRLAIKTFVQVRNHATIREAILREIMRGGQVYFLHNAVTSIPRIASELQQLMPEIRLAVAHGQMPERELERIMHDFYHQRFNVLLCTTIIESGIDVPNANTIIVDQAEHFGLAQLHQIRGRVGRSHHQAYAYLFTNHDKTLTPDAQKRLEALAAQEDLGTGFTLATQDLEIRGAGELLGEQQSGHMHAIGFSLYMELLQRAIDALNAGEQPDLDAPLISDAEINLQIPAFIPDTYVNDIATRLTLYKRIANAQDSEQLAALKVEFIDRFGLLPEMTQHLFAITALKLQAKPLNIRKIDANSHGGRIEFHAKPNVDPLTIINLIQQQPQHYKLDGPDKLRFFFATSEPQQRIKTIAAILQVLTLGL